MRCPRYSTISNALLLLCLGVVPAGCPQDPDEYTDTGGDIGVPPPGGGEEDSGGPPPPPPPESEPEATCKFRYQNMINDTGYEVDIWLIYLFPSGASDIGDDLLGSEILPYGYTLEVSGVPEGRYDTMVVDEDAFYYIEDGVVCDGSDWTWTITVSDVDGRLDVSDADQELHVVAEEAWPLEDSERDPSRTTRRAM